MNSFYARRVLGFTFFTVFSGFLFGQTTAEKTEIIKDYNQQELSKLEQDFKMEAEVSKERAVQLAAINGWPLTFTTSKGSFAELQGVDENDNPLYYVTSNVDASESTRTNHLNSGGSLGLNLNGDNMTAYVWDGGVARASHQEYDGAGGANRFSVGDGSSSLNFHAAHVTGTIIASGVQAAAKGMAPMANAIGSDWNSDLSEATNAAASGMLVSNHSYGYGIRDNFGNVQLPQYYFGGYIGVSRSWDQIMYNAPNYLMVVAAGNDGNDNTANANPIGGNSSYDKLNGTSTCKNNLVVANAQDANVNASGDLISVSINSGSSEGPTDDLRIKPDITGNGTGVYSTYESSNSAYASISGTSMASPNVTGSLLLLQEHYNNVNGTYMRAATLKGLALHTADDAGANGPDAVFGWGLMNSKRAAEAISNNGGQSLIQELTLSPGQTYTINVDADGINDLLASISWTDLPGTANTGTVNPSTKYLVNDLDIRVSKSGTNYTPWRLTGPASNTKGDNDVDPYERVDVGNASGTYTITVTHKGSLSGGSQNFSLIVTGLSGGSGPGPIACSTTISNFPYAEGFENTLGAWSQSTGDDFDWTVQTGATASSNTGPSASNEGSYYVYMESSTPNYATKNALLTSPCFDLTGLTNPTFSFDYHMYGAAAMGGLNLEVSADGGAWTTVWSKTGDQGNAWLSESIGLSAYSSSSEVKLRFNGTTGTTWQGDMAVDNINVDGETVSGPSCSTTITSFPYNESYENTLGAWTQDSDDDFNWTVQSGSTPSSNTGPTSANAGSYYAYMESSTPNYATKNAKLTSPCFDLTGLSNPEVTFDYHLYGASAMGELNLEVSTDGTTWTTLWNRTGNQGNAWLSTAVDLSAYSSSSAVKLRFNGTTGTTWQGDMAIDAVSVQGAAPVCTDVSLSITFDNYPEETSWEITSGSSVVASGGTYASQADGSTLNIPLCLNDGCYTFTISDAYGDGICCAYGNGSYTLTNDSNGATLASGGSFASNESTNFCIGSGTNSQLSDMADVTSEGSHFTMYPNPVNDVLYVEFNSTRKQSYQVLDLNGKILFDGNLENSMINFSPLSTGVYIMKITDGTKTIMRKVMKK
ncbi:MAG: S8 family serine peptidase [Crocinitomicaceae bacterium]|nr:S8 family serine peptidase [Crocinitomicaceae bacterium]